MAKLADAAGSEPVPLGAGGSTPPSDKRDRNSKVESLPFKQKVGGSSPSGLILSNEEYNEGKDL
jgi:hypothetical protein